MSYCILRMAKLNHMGNIAGSAGHTFRQLPTPNADPARTPKNVTIGANGMAAVCAAVEARLPAKRRKDAVLCIEYLITASPEFFTSTREENWKEYFRDAIRWLHARHGKENVVSMNLQLDETSPHLVAYVVPITSDGRLSAKDFFGSRKKLSEMQTEFHEKVGKRAGLERGVVGSKAHHTTNKQYNAALKKNPELKPPTRPKALKPAPAPSMLDQLTGRAAKIRAKHEEEVKEHEAEMLSYRASQREYVSLLDQARKVALLGQPARLARERELKRLRDEVATLRKYEKEAQDLRQENKRLNGVISSLREAMATLQQKYEAAVAWGRGLVAELAKFMPKPASEEIEARSAPGAGSMRP